MIVLCYCLFSVLLMGEEVGRAMMAMTMARKRRSIERLGRRGLRERAVNADILLSPRILRYLLGRVDQDFHTSLVVETRR